MSSLRACTPTPGCRPVADEFSRLISAGAKNAASRRPPKSYARVWVGLVGLLITAGIVGLITLTPNPVDKGFSGTIVKLLDKLHGWLLPGWFGYTELEFTANIVMFVPLGFFIGLLFTRRTQWLGLLALPAISAGIEWVQWEFLAERYSTLSDVLANSLGGWIGLGIAALFRAAIYARDEYVIDRALWDAGR